MKSRKAWFSREGLEPEMRVSAASEDQPKLDMRGEKEVLPMPSIVKMLFAPTPAA